MRLRQPRLGRQLAVHCRWRLMRPTGRSGYPTPDRFWNTTDGAGSPAAQVKV